MYCGATLTEVRSDPSIRDTAIPLCVIGPETVLGSGKVTAAGHCQQSPQYSRAVAEAGRRTAVDAVSLKQHLPNGQAVMQAVIFSHLRRKRVLRQH